MGFKINKPAAASPAAKPARPQEQTKTINVNANASKVAAALSLPEDENTPSDKVSDYVIMLAGEKKIGKTAFAAQFPNHFIIEGEAGNAKHLKCRFRDLLAWKDLRGYIDLLASNPGYASTIIIDDIPSVYRLCEAHVLKARGIEHAGDESHGKGWAAIEKEFTNVLNLVQGLPGGKIYTAHNVFREYERKTGGKFNRLETSCGTQADRYMDTIVHIWAVMQYDVDGGRIMTIKGDELLKAGCGVEGHFLHPKTGEQLINIPLGKSAEEAYENFCQAWDNQLNVSLDDQKKPFIADKGYQRAKMGKK